MQKEGLDKVVLKTLNLTPPNLTDMDNWKIFLNKLKSPKNIIKIGLIGKYLEIQDSYKSILESLIHSGTYYDTKVEVEMINSEFLNYKNVDSKLNNLSGVIVAPGFGERGIEGKITAVNYVRKNDIPFFGICFGMQMAVIEHSRNVLGLSTANSTEIDRDTKYPVISIMDNQKKIINKGGTMRLGSWRCDLKKGSLAYSAYRKNQIFERHRHRYEYNNDYMKKLEDSGLVATGINPDTKLVEIIENINNKWFIGVQYHPEFKSTVLNPHPLFKSFMKASLERFKNSRV